MFLPLNCHAELNRHIKLTCHAACTPVKLSAAKHLAAPRASPFAECTPSATNVLKLTIGGSSQGEK